MRARDMIIDHSDFYPGVYVCLRLLRNSKYVYFCAIHIFPPVGFGGTNYTIFEEIVIYANW